MKSQGGFTLIELLVIIAVIAALIAVIFAALDPATRFDQAKDAVRQGDVNEIHSALSLYAADHENELLPPVRDAKAGEVYMIVSSDTQKGCARQNDVCQTVVTSDTHCVDLSELVVQEYLTELPVSPEGEVAWSGAGPELVAGIGYTLTRTPEGEVIVRSCELGDPSNSEIIAQ